MKLKRIVENLNKIPANGGFDETPKLTPDQKRRLKEMVSRFNEFGEALRQEQKIIETAKTLSEIAKLAEMYACNESDEWMQTETIKRDFKRVNGISNDFQKIAKECYSKMQQMGALYEDMGTVLQRYFEITDIPDVTDNPTDQSGNNPGNVAAGQPQALTSETTEEPEEEIEDEKTDFSLRNLCPKQ